MLVSIHTQVEYKVHLELLMKTRVYSALHILTSHTLSSDKCTYCKLNLNVKYITRESKCNRIKNVGLHLHMDKITIT